MLLRLLERESRSERKRIPFQSPAYIVKTVLAGVCPLKDYIEERALAVANYIVESRATVRQTARRFGISKSTVHMEVTK